MSRLLTEFFDLLSDLRFFYKGVKGFLGDGLMKRLLFWSKVMCFDLRQAKFVLWISLKNMVHHSEIYKARTHYCCNHNDVCLYTKANISTYSNQFANCWLPEPKLKIKRFKHNELLLLLNKYLFEYLSR